MKTDNLKTMTEFVRGILDYTHESHNYERGIDLLKWYSDLLNEPLNINMFTGENPLFPNFNIVANSKYATQNNIENSVFKFANKEFGITLYRNSKYSTSKSGMCYITSYHLKKVEDLCGRDIEFNIDSEYSKSEIELY